MLLLLWLFVVLMTPRDMRGESTLNIEYSPDWKKKEKM
jgi:hypothetical protein